MNSIDAFTYSKNDVKKDLNFLNIKLNDDFKIIDNKIDGFPEYFQNTKIQISDNDKNRIINEIKTAKNFKQEPVNGFPQIDYEIRSKSEYSTWNYKSEKYYVRDYYEKHEGYVPIEIIIYLEENSNILKLNREED